MIRMLIPVVLVAACSKTEQKPPPEQKSAAAPTAPAATSSVTPELVQFCAANYFKVMDCFKDDEFWETFSTIYFANTKLTADAAERKQWVGILKEDMLKFYNEHGFEKNCEAALEHNRTPSAQSMKTVSAARQQSCAAFASAFGYMLFNEGALYLPK